MAPPVDVLVVCIDATRGWTEANRELEAGLRRAGASVETVLTGPVPRVRTFALTDLTQALMARRAAARGIARHHPRAIIYCSITAALLWPRPGAIFLDATAHENRPGRHGVWQRPMESRRLAQAPLLLPWSERSLVHAPAQRAPAFTLPPPIEVPAPVPDGADRDLAAITYAGDPVKRRLEHMLAAWHRARRPGETLTVCGLDGFDPPDGVRSAGRVSRDQFRRLLQRSRVFLAAPQREDHGIAALEALACGCRLVTTAARGAYPALDIARAADPRLVGDDLAQGIRRALDEPAGEYASVVARRLAPFTAEVMNRQLADVILPRLLTGRPAAIRA
jgi:glycosyltransferase involved in cell wall biosynthesis